MKSKLLSFLCLFALLCVTAIALAGLTPTHAAAARPETGHWSHCSVWYRCPVTQYFGHDPGHWSLEHGTDLATHGLVITAFLAGTVTFVREMPWDGAGVEDITWRVDRPWLSRGFKYAYVQIHRYSNFVHVGQHINVGTALGVSDDFMEFGLSHSWAYGWAGNWWTDWTTDPRFLLLRM